MATRYRDFLPEGAQFPATNFPQYLRVAGTNFPVTGLAYDGGSTNEEAFWKFVISNYGSGNITVTVFWYADTASSGNVQWGARIAAITPNSDTQDIETKALATATETQDSHLGTTGQRLHSIDVVVSNLDSVADGDLVTLGIYRDASDTSNDTMTGDAILVAARVSYSDT